MLHLGMLVDLVRCLISGIILKDEIEHALSLTALRNQQCQFVNVTATRPIATRRKIFDTDAK